VDLAHEEGINFDTADRYGSEPGETETIIGNWFVSRGGWRERTVIATKVYGEMGSCPNEGKVEETWQAIEVPVQAGKILYAGGCNFAGWQNRMVQTRIANLGDIAGYRRRRE
jgi:NDP-hexose C3-ketoreductase / dTDP-4-oxo-2-deoxy-alpha-D-pentos-2-ene 2,3-reductase